MTNAEIKKAWERMKKEVKNELGISYGFVMSKKQIENRTATYCLYWAPESAVKERLKAIKESQAFENFQAAVGKTTCAIERDPEGLYRIRFRY